MGGGFFDIRDDADFFTIVKNTLNSFLATNTKRADQLLLLVLGLVHLREWIAPGYKRGATPKTAGERFAAMLFEDENYQTVLLLANHAKHQRREALPETQTTSFVETFDERDTPIDSWLDFNQGPAACYQYGQRNLVDVLRNVASLYEQHWFDLPIEERLK